MIGEEIQIRQCGPLHVQAYRPSDVDVGLDPLDVSNHVPIEGVELNHASCRVGPAEVGV